jgi:two-component system response regulator YesN
MINVLIVDDDKLVRKGLMSAMPWASFGMRVIGEAGNGERALEFLEGNPVDLLMTDLAMPVMSGIELIRIVRKRYPDVAIAVLTLHQDFEYIQEALRLGAIDYIAKVQLEKEQFEEVLGRIHARMLSERRNTADEPDLPDRDVYLQDTAYALLALGEKSALGGASRQAELSTEWKTEGDGCILLWSPEAGDSLQLDELTGEQRMPELPWGLCSANWRMLRLRHATGMFSADLHQLLHKYRQRDLFYDCDGHEPSPIERSVLDLQTEQPEQGALDASSAKEALHSFKWVYDERSLDELCSRLKELRLPIPKLMQLLYGFTVDWNRLYRAVTTAGMTLPETFLCWREVEAWMIGFRETALTLTGSLHLSPEVSGSILSAVKMVHDELEHPLFAIDVAKRVNLSRSYFNQCFKEMVGYSFNEYLRKARIDKAREYLAQTAKPIIWIAEHTGYADEKYFSRTFREQTGMLPSEYRNQHKQR